MIYITTQSIQVLQRLKKSLLFNYVQLVQYHTSFEYNDFQDIKVILVINKLKFFFENF